MVVYRKRRHHALIGILPVLLITLFFNGGCGGTKIGDIQSEIDRFKDTRVTLSGKVTETLALPLVHKGAYQLDDGTGKIWIIPDGDVPSRGDKTNVSGTVRVGVEIAGKSFGAVLIED